MPGRSLRDLVDLALGGNLRQRLVRWREWGESWESIARRLAAEDGITVSADTVRRWARQLDVDGDAR